MKSYKLIGQGPQKVLLFPGLLGTQDAFDAMLQYADLERFQYAVAEYRGYGASKSLPGLYTLREVVIDACKLVEFLGWQHFAVGGHSIGALAAQMVAIAMPKRVTSIVSIAGLSAKGGSRDPQRVAFLNTAAHSAEHREQMVAGGTANRYGRGFAQAQVSATFDRIDPAAFASYAKDASQTDVSEEARALSMPILALAGQFDPACGEQAARATTASIYRTASVEVIPGAGHYPHCEAPAATVTLVENFIAAPGHAA